MNQPNQVHITPTVQVGPGQKLLLIAGPCQIESLEHARMIATFLIELQKKYPINLVYKSSFDKANRTSLQGTRGIGMLEGLEILGKIRSEFNIPTLTDIHLPEQAAQVAPYADILQIPAFLCRQTDLLLAAGNTGRAIHVKKGQFLHPEDMRHAANKISSTGNNNIILCERGSCFGYRDLVVDMRSLLIMRNTGHPVVFDATHSVQQMGGAGGSSGGMREFIKPLIRAAVAIGIDGLFIECHEEPARAPSDGASMLPLSEMEETISTALKIREAASR